MTATRVRRAVAVQAVACIGLLLSLGFPGFMPLAQAASPQAPAAASRLAATVTSSGAICSAEKALQAAISRRVPAVRWVGSAADVTLNVEWSGSVTDITADLSILSEGKAPIHRRLSGTHCESLRAAIALVAAISLEQYLAQAAPRRSAPVLPPPAAASDAPQAPANSTSRPRRPKRPTDTSVNTSHPPDTSANDITAASTPPSPPARNEQPVVQIIELPPAPTRESPAPVIALPPVEPSPSVGQKSPRKHAPAEAGTETAPAFSVRLDANSSIGLTPQPLFGVGVAGLLTIPGFGGWKPQVQAGVLWSPHREFDLDTAQVDFAMQAATVAFCPLALRHAGWHLAPCLGAEWGALIAEGRRVFSPQRHRRNWRALTAQAQGTFPVYRTLRGFAGFGAVLPLTVDRFEVAGADAFHRPAQPVLRVVLGLDWGLI